MGRKIITYRVTDEEHARLDDLIKLAKALGFTQEETIQEFITVAIDSLYNRMKAEYERRIGLRVVLPQEIIAKGSVGGRSESTRPEKVGTEDSSQTRAA